MNDITLRSITKLFLVLRIVSSSHVNCPVSSQSSWVIRTQDVQTTVGKPSMKYVIGTSDKRGTCQQCILYMLKHHSSLPESNTWNTFASETMVSFHKIIRKGTCQLRKYLMKCENRIITQWFIAWCQQGRRANSDSVSTGGNASQDFPHY